VKLNSIDLNKVAVFCQVVESGNYRIASDLLHVTPSALSQTVSSLEHSLGFPLFHRIGKKLTPTATGIQLHRDFRKHHLALLQAVRHLVSQKDQVQGLIRIGSYLEFAKSQLTPLLQSFLQAHPETQIKLTFETPSRLQRLLEENKLDLCFSIFPSAERPRIRSQKIFEEELVLITPPGWFGAQPTYAEIMKSPMVEYYFNHQPIRRWIELHYRKKPSELPIRIFAATAEMALSLVQQGVGIAVVPGYLVERQIPHVEECRPTTRKYQAPIWMLEPNRKNPSLLHRTFREHISRGFKNS
jgi:DNA-binding transcriptional LysR family regulator